VAISNTATIRVRINGKDAEVDIKNLGDIISKSMKKGKQEADKLKSSISKIGDFSQKIWFGIQNLRMVGGTIKEMTTLALKANDVKAAFEGIADADFLEKLRENVKGTVSDFDLMQKTVEAIDLGATNEQLETFTKFARLEAVRKGGNTMVKFGEIVSGVLRGSTELLDNFGINLTDLNRKIEELADGKRLGAVERRALSVDAAVALMNERMARTGELALSDAERVARAEAKWKNMKITLGKVLAQLAPLVDVATKFFDLISKMNPKLISTIAVVTAIIALLWKVRAALIAVQISAGPIGWVLGAITLAAGLLIPNLVSAGDEFENLSGDVDGATTAMQKFNKEIDNWDVNKVKAEIAALDSEIESTGGRVESYLERVTKLEKEYAKDHNRIVKNMLDDMTERYEAENTKLNELYDKQNALLDELEARRKVKAKKHGEENAKAWLEGALTYIKNMKADVSDFARLMSVGLTGVVELKDKFIGAFQEIEMESIESFYAMSQSAKDMYGMLASGIDALTSRMVESLWNTKTKFKDIWKMMAQDFLTYFLRKVIYTQILSFIPGLSQVAGLGSPPISGFGSAGMSNLSAGSGQLSSMNNELQKISGLLRKQQTTINVMLDDNALLGAMSRAKRNYNIRQGNDVNREIW